MKPVPSHLENFNTVQAVFLHRSNLLIYTERQTSLYGGNCSIQFKVWHAFPDCSDLDVPGHVWSLPPAWSECLGSWRCDAESWRSGRRPLGLSCCGKDTCQRQTAEFRTVLQRLSYKLYWIANINKKWTKIHYSSNIILKNLKRMCLPRNVDNVISPSGLRADALEELLQGRNQQRGLALPKKIHEHCFLLQSQVQKAQAVQYCRLQVLFTCKGRVMHSSVRTKTQVLSICLTAVHAFSPGKGA